MQLIHFQWLYNIIQCQPGLFMNRRDDRVEPLFATDFSERGRSHCLRAIDKVKALARRECLGVSMKNLLRAKGQARARQHL